MRVIAGTARGRRLVTPTGRATRPTADRVKEALFSILHSLDTVDDARVLDLFAGSGALGIEALSRGACTAVFIEQASPALKALSSNLESCGFTQQATVMGCDVKRGLAQLKRNNAPFDLIFMDPPYHGELYQETIMALAGLVTEHTVLVAESASKNPLPDRIGPFVCIRRRTYGDTMLEFFTTEQSDAP